MRGTKARTAGAKQRGEIWQGAIFTLFNTFAALRVCFFSRPGRIFRPAAEIHPAHFQPFPSAPSPAATAPESPSARRRRKPCCPPTVLPPAPGIAFPAPPAPTSAPRAGRNGGFLTCRHGDGRDTRRAVEKGGREKRGHLSHGETIRFGARKVCFCRPTPYPCPHHGAAPATGSAAA